MLQETAIQASDMAHGPLVLLFYTLTILNDCTVFQSKILKIKQASWYIPKVCERREICSLNYSSYVSPVSGIGMGLFNALARSTGGIVDFANTSFEQLKRY